MRSFTGRTPSAFSFRCAGWHLDIAYDTFDICSNAERARTRYVALRFTQSMARVTGCGRAELTRLLLRRHLSHALLTLVGGWRPAEASRVAEDIVCASPCVKSRWKVQRHARYTPNQPQDFAEVRTVVPLGPKISSHSQPPPSFPLRSPCTILSRKVYNPYAGNRFGCNEPGLQTALAYNPITTASALM